MHRTTVRAACAVSLLLGLFFVFVRAPHPWAWEGFDGYHDLARIVARGEPYPTTDRPWGYAYFLAAFYRPFGDHPWIPLVAQVALNALMPLLVYEFARSEFDARVAVAAAWITALCSFNTVYASTQASDAVCNVLFMAGVASFVRAWRRDDWRWFAVAGALFGLAAQFRPNLILIPAVAAAFALVRARSRAVSAATIVAAAALTLAPWILRNYRLTGEVLPTSTRGGLQLWYGTLQTGPYLKSRAYNPRSVFEQGSFPYTSLDRVPLVVTGALAACAVRPDAVDVTFWTDRDPAHRRVAARWDGPRQFVAELPVSPAPTAYYYYAGPLEPADAPHVFFVSGDHLGDIDRHDDLLDVFDVVRLLRHIAFGEPVAARRLDLDGDGRIDEADVRVAVQTLLARGTTAAGSTADASSLRIVAGRDRAALAFGDGSALAVPQIWSGRVTDLEVSGPTAEALLHAYVPFTQLSRAGDGSKGCRPLEHIAVNEVFYRDEPHTMRRYSALAFDNIRRDRGAYLASVAYRAGRVFVIEGSDDPKTTHQFSGSGRIYAAANLFSLAVIALFVAGIWTAWRSGASIAFPLLLIAYIPATLAFVLTNMRYSIAVQPLLFVFAASALVTAANAVRRRRASHPAAAAGGRAGNRTARQP